MKRVNRQELMTMPEGTIYSGYTPHVADGLFRKGRTLVSNGVMTDWYVASLIAGLSMERLEGGLFPMATDDVESREGLFDGGMEYVVYEEADIAVLRRMLGVPPVAA